MRTSILLAGAALAAGLSMTAAANAGTILGTETPGQGFVGDLFPGFGYMVGSDSESSFDPFGAGYDTSDGLNFSQVAVPWSQVAGGAWNNVPSATGAPSQTWVLPATIPGCGSENATTCEPGGHFISPVPWNYGTGTYYIMDEDGKTVSDIIQLWNDANGNAHVDFYSDPLGIPEPATWAMMILGVGLVGFAARRRTAAVAA